MRAIRNKENWYDYGARFYDPAIGRWHSVDLLSEYHYDVTPYNYVLNNPIKYLDFFGLDTASYTSTDPETGKPIPGFYLPEVEFSNESNNEAATVYMFNSDKFEEVEPQKINHPPITNLKTGKEIAKDFSKPIKLLKKATRARPQLIDPYPALNRRLSKIILGKLKTLGPGNSVILPMFDATTDQVYGVQEITYEGINSNGKDSFSIEYIVYEDKSNIDNEGFGN